MTKFDPPGGYDLLGLPAQWDGKEPFVSPSGVYAPVVLPCTKLGHFRDFTGTCCVYCGDEVQP
jgi:hypothetical protein